MAAKGSPKQRLGEEGQSVIEFCLLLPVMLILTVMLIKINTAIQMSIVNQQYARAQALYLAYNSPYFPQLRLREVNLTAKGMNQMVVGVADNQILGDTTPDPSIESITRRGVTGSDERETPTERSRVRIRTTVGICTQQNVLQDGTAILSLNTAGAADTSAAFAPTGAFALNEVSKFSLCASPYQGGSK